jgi:hypothetical protein
MAVAPVHRNGVLPHGINFQRLYPMIKFIFVQNFLACILYLTFPGAIVLKDFCAVNARMMARNTECTIDCCEKWEPQCYRK